MKTVNATEMKHRLGEALNRARKEPIAITTHGKPSHVLMSYEEYQTLSRPDGAVYFHEIEDAEERMKAFDEWTAELMEGVQPVDVGIVKREDFY
jgi:prevent-host-death family protein